MPQGAPCRNGSQMAPRLQGLGGLRGGGDPLAAASGTCGSHFYFSCWGRRCDLLAASIQRTHKPRLFLGPSMEQCDPGSPPPPPPHSPSGTCCAPPSHTPCSQPHCSHFSASQIPRSAGQGTGSLNWAQIPSPVDQGLVGGSLLDFLTPPLAFSLLTMLLSHPCHLQICLKESGGGHPRA